MNACGYEYEDRVEHPFWGEEHEYVSPTEPIEEEEE